MEITPFSLKVLEKDKKRILFEIEPLLPGYGVTLGNALRRVLLSSIEGSAITEVEIKGASHEFSTLDGVKEDVLEICLNLKKVRIKMPTLEEAEISLKAKGPQKGEKEVKAGEIETPPGVEIVNKDHKIATLTSPKASLEMTMKVKKGRGYVPAEMLKEKRGKIGKIYLDAIFSPIENVAFWVEEVRFEKRTDYNKLKMEILTDGQKTPEEALKEAIDILMSHFEKIKEKIK